MPLTAYSVAEAKELDVDQVLAALSRRHGVQAPIDVADLPESWREFLRTDLECPCCFVTGAELVREAISRTSRKAIRQRCFRFVTPGHRPQCDYAMSDTNSTPENLVNFGTANSNLTRAVRELVCTGIQTGAFSQRSVRDMREWFFQKKAQASFRVVLDPRIPKWVDKLHRLPFLSTGSVPTGVPLTVEIATMPGFDWVAESARLLVERHRAVLDVVNEKRLWWMPDAGNRIESLARRYQGEVVFDPTVLHKEYDQSLRLALFISHNYAPIRSVTKAKPYSAAACVLAFSALLLFVNDWDLNRAVGTFAVIARSAGHADQGLGNVMGLNPFHDYEAWRKLKQLQESGIPVPDETDPSVERRRIEDELRARFGA